MNHDKGRRKSYALKDRVCGEKATASREDTEKPKARMKEKLESRATMLWA